MNVDLRKKFDAIPGQLTIDLAITADILQRNLELILHALADAQSWREDQDDDDAAELYAALAAELEEFQ